jgi:diguanylate cyclase (GGDEF)-like protein/PAS domain S-box-containing protein
MDLAGTDVDAALALFEQAPVGMALLDGEGQVVQANAAYLRLLPDGIDPAWLIPDTPEAITRAVPGPGGGERRLVRVRVVGAQRETAPSASLLVYVEAVDQAGPADHLTALLDRAADVIAVVDPRGVVAYANATVTDLLRWTVEQVVGRTALSFVHPDDLDRAASALSDALDGVDAVPPAEVRLRHRHGGHRWFEVLASGWIDAPGGVHGVVLNLRENTARHELADLAARRTELDRLSVDVSRQALETSLNDVKEALPAILAHLGRLLGAHHVHVALVGEPPGALTTLAAWTAPDYGPICPAGRYTALEAVPAVLAALQAGELVVEEDLQQRPPAWSAEWYRTAVPPARSAVLCPLAVGGRLLGVLGMEHAQPSHWLHDELTAVRSVAEALAVALARDHARRALVESEQRFRLIAEHSNDVIVLFDVDGRCRYVSPSSRATLGYEPDALVGRPSHEFIHPADRAAVIAAWQAFVHGDEAAMTVTYRFERPDGAVVWLEQVNRALRDPDTGVLTAVQGSARDITSRKAVEGELARLALHDPLTGIANRALVEERLAAALAQRAGRGSIFSVLAIDLDGFKDVNDEHGHQAGDGALVVVAERLSKLVRDTDTVGRVGGDEFMVVCPDTGEAAAVALAERLVAAIDEPVPVGDGVARVGASIGVAPADAGHPAVDDVVRAADLAMYEAKRAGKGCVRVRRP